MEAGASGDGGGKAALELRKLAAETRKAEHDAAHLKRAERLKLLSTVLPALTILVTVCAVGLGYWHQSREAERSRANRREDQFTAAVRDFGSSSETAQAAAIATLDQYWRDPVFRDRVQDLLIASIETVRSPGARVQIQRQFIEHADSGSLARLADQNRALTDRLFEIDPGMVRIAAVNPSSPITTATDSLGASIQELLGWNIATLIATINQLRNVRDADLSNVSLSRYRATFINDSQQVVLSRLDQAQLAPGVTLKAVDLSGAFLAGLMFDSVTISDVSLDSANLTHTLFQHSRLEGKTSVAAFKTWFDHSVLPRMPEGAGLRSIQVSRGPANWQNSTLDVDRFYPDARWDFSGDIGTHVQFYKMNWRIRLPPPQPEFGIMPHIPARGTVNSRVRDLTIN